MNRTELIQKAAEFLETIRERERTLERFITEETEFEEKRDMCVYLSSGRWVRRTVRARQGVQAAREELETWVRGLSHESRCLLFENYGCLSNLTTPFYGGVGNAFVKKQPGRSRRPHLPEDPCLEDFYFVGSALARRSKGSQMPGAYAASHKNDQESPNGRR